MTDKVDMTHETLKAYIYGNRDVITETQREGNSRLQLLLDLVDQSVSVSKLPTSSEASDTQFTFEQTEDILSDILAGTDSKITQQNFLAALYYSPDFYQRVMIKLDELVPVIEGRLDTELMEVAVREDEQVLEELGIGNSGDSLLEDKTKTKSTVDSVLQKLFGWMGPRPRYAYVMAALVLAMIIIMPGSIVVYYAVVADQPRDIFAEYVYDEKVPYEYRESGLRGDSEAVIEDTGVQNFIYQFKMGMSDYLTYDYLSATRRWEIMDSTAEKLLEQNYSHIVREYYFFIGIAHLALGRDYKKSKEEHRTHLLKSINFLIRATLVAQKDKGMAIDREDFYLGLAYLFSGDIINSHNRLLKIKPESKYYQETIILINKTSHN